MPWEDRLITFAIFAGLVISERSGKIREGPNWARNYEKQIAWVLYEYRTIAIILTFYIGMIL